MQQQLQPVRIKYKLSWLCGAMLTCLFSCSCICSIFAQLTRPPLLGIAFVELQVSKPAEAKRFYEGLLGYSWPAGSIEVSDSNTVYDIKVNMRQTIRIRTGLSATADERLLSIAFQTTDAAAMRLYLESKKIKVPVAISNSKTGVKWFEVKDPDNHSVRFVEYAAGGRPASAVTKKNMISSRILHAGLTIGSAAGADAFYKDILGFSEIWRGGATDSVTSWINMRIPESTDYIEYMLVSAPVNRQQLGSLHHIALLVPDMQTALDTLNERNKFIHYPVAAPRVGRNRRWQLNLFDMDGSRIELMEPFPMR